MSDDYYLFAIAVAERSPFYQSSSTPVIIDYDDIPPHIQDLADQIREGC